MTDLSFLASVVATLLVNAGRGFVSAAGEQAGGSAWPGSARLLAVVHARFSGDSDAGSALPGAGVDPAADHVESLAAAVRRYADLDPDFREEIRRLVVEAYADPATARWLPDPSPDVR